MKDEIQIFVGNNGLDLKDFYPDDLPKEWQFDYYSSQYGALMLNDDGDIDFEEVLEDIDLNFRLVIKINNVKNIDTFLKKINKYKENFILYSNDMKIYDKLKFYNFCIKSNIKNNKCDNIGDLYFNSAVVLVESAITDDKKLSDYIKKLKKYNKNIVLIQENTDSETIKKIQIICDLLFF
jgi:anion-transporting  ArsA/GET3 family ATPase